MVRCTVLGCKKKAKYKGKSLCFVHLHNKTHVEITMPFEIEAPKKRGRKKKDVRQTVNVSPIGETIVKDEPIVQVANVTN
jgi:hypothetical protein